MEYLVGVETDIGLEKSTNQDSVMIRLGHTINENVAIVILCDGMGGLEKGEVASASVISMFSDWFKIEFPYLLRNKFFIENVKKHWERLIKDKNKKLYEYGRSIKTNLGTTVTGILFIDDKYLIVNVGDSRVYLLSDGIHQITEDQSVVAREVKLGKLSKQEAEKDPRRNVLLQCIGATSDVEVEFYEGIAKPNEAFMLCSDGFRHEITEEELFSELNPNNYNSEEEINEKIHKIIEMNKKREESDNITAAVIKLK